MKNTKKIAVILSGCGVFDGSEIHETVLTMLAIAKNNCEYEIFAPDIKQMHVIDHLSGKVMNEERSVLSESARIARGKIHPLEELDTGEFDAIILPGGFGAAKNLSSYAAEGENMEVDKAVEKVLIKMKESHKPIGATCISPVIISKVFGNVEVTLGHDDPSIDHVQAMGSSHMDTNNGQIVIDEKNKVVTAPCYMLDAKITDIEIETDLLVKAILGMMA